MSKQVVTQALDGGFGAMQAISDLAERTVTLARNEYVKVKGGVDTNVYFVEDGSLRVFVFDNGEEQNIRFGYKGNLIVALDSFLTGKPTLFHMQAIKKTVLKVITRQRLDQFLNAPGNQVVWTRILEGLIVQQLEREVDILTTSPRQRYERVLRRSPQLFQVIPHRHIANYLRMTPETLSRLKKS